MCAVELRKGGLQLAGTALWLDAHRKAELSFVSHAHSDHIAPHAQVIATPETLRLMAHRLRRMPSAMALTYREPMQWQGLHIELLPAGHILGSAQIRITREDGWRVVYTGDFTLAPSLTAVPAQIPECDTLVMESTFGHPRYQFPPKGEVLAAIDAWVSRQLGTGRTPVLLCYPLGKSQEVMKFLSQRGHALCAHASIWEVTQLYGECGMAVGDVRRFDGEVRPGEVAVFPPRLARGQGIAKIYPRATAILTGWAMDGASSRRCGADVAFPLSDHADFPALVSFAEGSGAREILTHHGFSKELAQALCKRGMQARPAGTVKQLSLFS